MVGAFPFIGPERVWTRYDKFGLVPGVYGLKRAATGPERPHGRQGQH